MPTSTSPAAGLPLNRIEQSLRVLEAFKKWLDDLYGEVLPTQLLGKAIKYCEEYWDSLCGYLDCEYATPDNNTAERAIRPFVVGRNAWLFNNTARGAEASALYYSLIETAKANDIDLNLYILSILLKAPECNTEQDYEKLLPWVIDTNEAKQLHKLYKTAKPNPERVEPYILNKNYY